MTQPTDVGASAPTTAGPMTLTIETSQLVVVEVIIRDDSLWVNVNGNFVDAKNCKHVLVKAEPQP
jgi:hypothetical protein